MNDSNAISSILDATLDDLADLPAFQPFPAGAHRVTLKFDVKEVNKKAAVELTMTVIETVELADASATPAKQGDSTNILYQLDNEFGQGKLKEIIKVLQPALGGTTTRETMEAANGAEVLVVTKIRANKTNPDQKYTDIVSMAVV